VSQLFGVETGERDLVVSATSFKNDAVTIDIEAHLKTTQAMKEGELKTAVIATIAKCIQKTFVKSSDEKSNSRVPANWFDFQKHGKQTKEKWVDYKTLARHEA
jgi:hypothetical protein